MKYDEWNQFKCISPFATMENNKSNICIIISTIQTIFNPKIHHIDCGAYTEKCASSHCNVYINVLFVCVIYIFEHSLGDSI